MSKAILFDMDGVLVDSEGVMLRAAAAGLRAFGIEANPEDFIPYIGLDAEHYFGNVMKKYGRSYSEEVKVYTYTLYGDLISPDDVCPGAVELLAALRRNNIPFAICSGAVRQKVKANLKALGLEEDQSVTVLTGDDVVQNKPHPEIYCKGAALIDVNPEECIVVEDSLNGIKAGKNSGAVTVGVGTTLSPEEFAKEGNADYFIASLKDLPVILSKNGIILNEQKTAVL